MAYQIASDLANVSSVRDSSDYLDLIVSTLKNFEKLTWTDLVPSLQKHTAMPELLRKKRVEFGSGYGHQFNVRLYSNNAARNVKLNEEDNPTTADVLDTGQVGWRHSETHWAIEERIIAMNREPARLVDLLKVSRIDAMTSLAELMENNFWGEPPASSDEVKPLGIKYWISKDSGETSIDGPPATAGFKGDLPVKDDNTDLGHTKVGGLAPSVAENGVNDDSKWRNWVGKYTNVSKSDLIRKMREASVKTFFKPPVDGPFSNKSVDHAYYTTYAVISKMEEILESQNDNLGNDVASKDGLVQFRRNPVIWVPKIDDDVYSGTSKIDAVYGVNWNNFKPVFLRGEYMKESRVSPHPLHHRTITQYVDCTYNFFCNDRRSQFVLAKG
tara:strand:+ start:834 stop:1988 length:1155 start_codon:yes stop_codon:yes gene_type:complete